MTMPASRATAARRFTATAAWRAMERAIAEHGAPRQLISDNGIQFISRSGHKPVHFQQPQVCGCAGRELN